MTASDNDCYALAKLGLTPAASATQNACSLCAPLGAALAFTGLADCVPLLHGSQGCATYIRRYLISHFREPVDIACSNFGENTAIFGGGENLKLALDNLRSQYAPRIIGVATTCLAETIGDDVALFLREYHQMRAGEELPPVVSVSTPSYAGSHAQGFHAAVRATVETLATSVSYAGAPRINLFPGMLSPADIRQLKALVAAFGLEATVLPDISQCLDGGLWRSYQRIAPGGTPLEAIAAAGSALASVELGRALACAEQSAATALERRWGVPAHRLGLPMGIRQTDRLVALLAQISGSATPPAIEGARERLLDALVDGHKHVSGVRAALFGDEDLVAGMVDFLSEIGVVPVVCASGASRGHLAAALAGALPTAQREALTVVADADFARIEDAVRQAQPELLIGHGKGYSLARRLKIPLVRIGFPIHDRLYGPRLLHVGYEGALALFDRIANTLIAIRQHRSPAGPTYM